MLLQLAVLVLLFARVGGSFSDRSYCELGNFPIALLARNETDGSFHLVKKLHPLTPNLTEGNFRRLDFADVQKQQLKGGSMIDAVTSVRRLGAGWIPGIQLQQRKRDLSDSMNTVAPNNSSLFYARECGCFGIEYPTVYCPFTVETCLRPTARNEDQIPGCMSRSPGSSFGLVAIILMALLYLAAIMYLFRSSMGRNVAGFIFSPCFRSWNRQVVDNILSEEDPEILRTRIDETFEGLPDSLERIIFERNNVTRRTPAAIIQTSMRLRTKTYKLSKEITATGSSAVGAMEEELDECAICHLVLENGDKIGHLTCNHNLHVSCLKNWLTRRNTCPLCQARGIAEVRHDIIDDCSSDSPSYDR